MREGASNYESKTNELSYPLFRFGNKEKPKPARPGKDISVDEDGRVHPSEPPEGVSFFGDIYQSPLTGHYHKVLEGTEIPEGLAVVPDGSDVGGDRLPTHHTVSPSWTMLFDDYQNLLDSIPYEYGGKKL